MVDVYFFTEMPYAAFDEKEAEAYPSMRLTFPNTFFDPKTAHKLFQNYFDQYQWAEEVGFDGLMINEHHNTPSCMDVAVNLSAGVLGRITKRAKILLLGNMLPTNDNPVRLAEEIAMADVISGGRIIAGVVRGIGIESWANNIVPNYNRERFEECHDLMLAAWTRPGPFRWEGQHYHFRVINPWVLPVQKPHPPIWVPGTGSPETIAWAAQHRYTYAAFLVPMETTVQLYATYREHAADVGYEADASSFAYMVCCVCADTDEAAQEIGKHYMWRMGHPLRGPVEYWAPPGYTGRRRPLRFPRMNWTLRCSRWRQRFARSHQWRSKLARKQRPYILIGPGRWGTADRWLGIPVQWGQIAGARMIVELAIPGFAPDPPSC